MTKKSKLLSPRALPRKEPRPLLLELPALQTLRPRRLRMRLKRRRKLRRKLRRGSWLPRRKESARKRRTASRLPRLRRGQGRRKKKLIRS